MPSQPLRWGLLSTARINRAIIPFLRTSRRSQLMAVASRSQAQAETYGREWGIPQAHASYQALIDDPDVDVIYNPLPNHLHAEWTIRAAQAGKHVLCEKPLALTADEVRAMQAAARQAGVVVAEAFMYRHHAKTLRVRELVQDGTLGEVHFGRGSFSVFNDRPEDYRWQPEMGGGSLWDVGCYPVSYARFVLGQEPQEVSGWQVSGPSGVDEHFCGQLRFPGDVFFQFDSSFRQVYRTNMEFVGSKAALQIASPFLPGRRDALVLQERKGAARKIGVPGGNSYAGEVEDMELAVLEGRPPGVSLEDSLGNVCTILALYESARLNRPVGLAGQVKD
jgi:D-xylose 1-dehydrogenase (NADP+, D-xylono-1,5-lactone-forming)